MKIKEIIFQRDGQGLRVVRTNNNNNSYMDILEDFMDNLLGKSIILDSQIKQLKRPESNGFGYQYMDIIPVNNDIAIKSSYVAPTSAVIMPKDKFIILLDMLNSYSDMSKKGRIEKLVVTFDVEWNIHTSIQYEKPL